MNNQSDGAVKVESSKQRGLHKKKDILPNVIVFTRGTRKVRESDTERSCRVGVYIYIYIYMVEGDPRDTGTMAWERRRRQSDPFVREGPIITRLFVDGSYHPSLSEYSEL